MSPLHRRSRNGFTLAEVAITLMIVGIALVFVLQGLSSAKFTAAHSHDRKVARDLALLTLGRVEAGLFWEDMDERLYGNYGEEGYEEWQWELVLGDETFSDEEYDRKEALFFDSFAERERREEERDDEDEDEEEEVEQAFEKVRIRVTWPKLGDLSNSLTLERWMPWELVHGSEEGEEQPAEEREP